MLKVKEFHRFIDRSDTSYWLDRLVKTPMKILIDLEFQLFISKLFITNVATLSILLN